MNNCIFLVKSIVFRKGKQTLRDKNYLNTYCKQFSVFNLAFLCFSRDDSTRDELPTVFCALLIWYIFGTMVIMGKVKWYHYKLYIWRMPLAIKHSCIKQPGLHLCLSYMYKFCTFMKEKFTRSLRIRGIFLFFRVSNLIYIYQTLQRQFPGHSIVFGFHEIFCFSVGTGIVLF